MNKINYKINMIKTINLKKIFNKKINLFNRKTNLKTILHQMTLKICNKKYIKMQKK